MTSPSSAYSPPNPGVTRAPTVRLTGPEKLNLFRYEIGINPVDDVARANRPASNQGIYKECVRQITKTKLAYWLCATVLNACLLAQVSIGAVLTALGASEGNHIVITVLGAANTVIASVLTYFKAQGLPYRLLAYLNELKRVRTSVEQKERDFMSGRWKDSNGKELDVFKEADALVRMFQDAKDTSEANHPETYTATGTGNGAGKGPMVANGDVADEVLQMDKKPIAKGKARSYDGMGFDGTGELEGEHKD
jgi:hypothetical protein